MSSLENWPNSGEAEDNNMEYRDELKKLLENPDNKLCADCYAKGNQIPFR
jgi:hypothetical protein